MRKILLSICAMASLLASAQLTVDTTLSPEQIVEDIFLSNGIFISNITYTGGDGFVGSFDGSATSLGLTTGIVMGSGSVDGAVGPNNSGSFTTNTSNIFNFEDADLNAIFGGYPANDPSIIEFDFIATGDSLDFQFVFGSEEYMEWVGSAFNDGFGFFISGPGISGPYTNGAVNIALVPGTDTPVAINNVNNGPNNEGPCTNCDYFVFNGHGYEEPYLSDPQYVQCDGLTSVLHASIGQLQIGEVYHIKLAIADASDAALDSYVFLGGNSFVQFCNETSEFLPNECLLSNLSADVLFDGSCSTITLMNNSEINIDYTNCYFEMGDGGILEACITNLEYTYAEPGLYQIKLVYEVGEFQAKFKLGWVEIAEAPPVEPIVVQNGNEFSIANAAEGVQIQWYLNQVAIEGANGSIYTATEPGTYAVMFTNSCGSSASGDFTIVSVGENNAAGISIYPNPTSGDVNIQTDGRPCFITVYDLTGRVVEQTSTNGNSVATLQLAVGTYIAQVTDVNTGNALSRELVIVK